MRIAIAYYSQHHGNTKTLVVAIAAQADVGLINVVENPDADLAEFDCIGFASGIYFAAFAKPLLAFAERKLPPHKSVFLMNTCGIQSGVYFDAIRRIIRAKDCQEVGAYQCLGFDTFGPFKLVGGIAKGHPNADEIAGAVSFFLKIRDSLGKC